MRPRWHTALSLALAALSSITSARQNYSSSSLNRQSFSFFDDRPDGCPPCFNCNLDDFKCHQFAQCGSLADGRDRAPRSPDQQSCKCKDGWEGVNCNVCKDNEACDALMPEGKDGICYREGLVQKENFQMCDITNQKILDQLRPQIPQATFSCNTETEECNFQCTLSHCY